MTQISCYQLQTPKEEQDLRPRFSNRLFPLMIQVSNQVFRTFQHRGLLGKSKTPISPAALLHLLRLNNQPVIAQVYSQASFQFIEKKKKNFKSLLQQLTAPNLILPLCYSIKRLTKQHSQFSVFYFPSVFGVSLQNQLLRHRKQAVPYQTEQIQEFLEQIIVAVQNAIDFEQFFDLSPFNIFVQKKGQFKYYLNNFAISFQGAPFFKFYANPLDQLYKLNKFSLPNLVTAAVFQIGLIALQMCTLQSSQELISQQGVDWSKLKGRVEKISDKTLGQIVASMLSEDQKSRPIFSTLKRQGDFLRFKPVSEKVKDSNKLVSGFVVGQVQLINILYQDGSQYRGASKSLSRNGYGIYQSEGIWQVGFFQNDFLKQGIKIMVIKGVIWIGDFTSGKGAALYSTNQQKIAYQVGLFIKQLDDVQLINGVTLFKDLRLHEGQWKNGYLQGQGSLIDLSRQIKVLGRWVGGVLQGLGKSFEKGEWFQIEWSQGVQSKRTLVNGNLPVNA